LDPADSSVWDLVEVLFEISVQPAPAGRKEVAMQVRPLYDRVLVKRVEEESKTAGGLFLPETAKEKPLMGEVLAVGQGRLGDDGVVRPLVLKEGDRVMFGRYAGTEIKVDGEERLVLREDEIFGVVEA
jgi:chaperonin GroES